MKRRGEIQMKMSLALPSHKYATEIEEMVIRILRMQTEHSVSPWKYLLIHEFINWKILNIGIRLIQSKIGQKREEKKDKMENN